MGYYERHCQLCGVSFAIARLRTAQESEEAAWGSHGAGFADFKDVVEIEKLCGPDSGCKAVSRAGTYGPDDHSVGVEHVAGPGCKWDRGYSGYEISAAEMLDCRTVQCLLKKDEGWEPEQGDASWEKDGAYFLTGKADGLPFSGPLEGLSPVRHGVDRCLISNFVDRRSLSRSGLPFHPACFEIFKQISVERLGKVDIHGLWTWRSIEEHIDSHTHLNGSFPRTEAVRKAQLQWWTHARGAAYLAANPLSIPALPKLLRSCDRGSDKGFNVNNSAFPDRSAPHNTADPFSNLPFELLSMILSSGVSSKDIANLRLVTRSCQQLPISIFRERLLADMPWLSEAKQMSRGTTDWFQLYNSMKGEWSNVNGIQNRKRIWTDVEEVVTRIGKYRSEGLVGPEILDLVPSY